jgi:hypothetical protein
VNKIVDFYALQPRLVRASRTEIGDDRFYTYPRTYEQWISVTSVTGGTSSKPWLGPWNSKIAATYAVMNYRDLLRLIRETTAAKTAELAGSGNALSKKAIATQARQAGEDAAIKLIKKQAELIRDRKANTGTYIHDVAEALIYWAASPEGQGGTVAIPPVPEHLQGKMYDEEPVEKVIDFMETGFLNFVSDFNPRFLAAEMAVFHPGLKVAGTLDTILVLEGYDLDAAGFLVYAPGNILVICVDFKTGKNLDSSIPEQLAIYQRAPECLLPMGELAAMPHIDCGAVLHLRPEFSRGYRFMPVSRKDDALAWNRFRRALDIYYGRMGAGNKPGFPAYPLRPDGTMPSRRCEDMDGEGYGRAPRALAKAGVDDLELLATLTGQDCLDLDGIGEKSLPLIERMLADHGLCLADGIPASETVKAA